MTKNLAVIDPGVNSKEGDTAPTVGAARSTQGSYWRNRVKSQRKKEQADQTGKMLVPASKKREAAAIGEIWPY